MTESALARREILNHCLPKGFGYLPRHPRTISRMCQRGELPLPSRLEARTAGECRTSKKYCRNKKRVADLESVTLKTHPIYHWSLT